MKKQIVSKIARAMKLSGCIVIHAFTLDEINEEIDVFMKEFNSQGLEVGLVIDSPNALNRVVKENEFAAERIELFKKADSVVDLFYIPGPMPTKEMTKEDIDCLRSYLGQMVSAMMTKEKVIQVKMDTQMIADNFDIEYDQYKQMISKAYDIDYEELERICEEKIKEVEKNTSPKLISQDGSVLSFDITGRKWYTDCGNGDFPAGEVYIAPVETKTNGEIYFDRIFLDCETRFTNVKIKIVDGFITESNNSEFNEFIQSLGEKPIVSELGIGLNKNIDSYVGNPVFDEKMIDTMHIAIGRNDMFGGEVSAPYHIDFVGKFEIR